MKKLKLIPRALVLLIFFLFSGITLWGQEKNSDTLNIKAEEQDIYTNEFTVTVPDSLENKPLIEIPQDSTETDTIKKKGLLEYQVIDNAKGYRKYNRKENKIYLYDQAYLKYGDMELNAGLIVVDLTENVAYAGGIKDSLGNYTQLPVFKQSGSEDIQPDSLYFNIKTKKGLVYRSRTKEGEMNVRTDIVKKVNDTLYYIYNTKITTSSHPDDDPEYYIKITKGVFVPGVKVIAGFSQMFFYDVPTPIVVPFAFFPMTKEKQSGLIFPTFGESGGRGYFIQNGGYYFAFNDYADLAVTGDYYTNGSYGLRTESAYALRYKFRGNVSLRFENQVNGQKGFSGYGRSTIYKIIWSHAQDAKASANSRFSASVNLGSSKYYQQTLNQSTNSNYLDNTFQSSISYSKTFPEYPSINLSVTATHSQNSQTGKIDMTLPTFQGSMERIYPFVKEGASKKGIIENINFQINSQGQNQISTVDSLFFKKEMFKDAKIGFQHSIPVTTNFKVFKYLSASLNTNYKEVWQFKTIKYNDYNTDLGEAVKDTVNGFDRFGTYNFGASLGTTIYGDFKFGEDKKIQAIRHVMRPSVSYGYTPSFDQYFDEYISDELGTVKDYTRFVGGPYGSPGQSYSNSIGLSLNNTLEAKVRDKDSLATEPKKIKILNNLNFSTNYNIAADSLAWSPLSVTGSTQFFDNKMPVNFRATLDPYAIDANGRRFDKFNISNGGSLFRLTNAGITTSYAFSSKDFVKKEKDKDGPPDPDEANEDPYDGLFGEDQDFSDNRTMDQKDPDKEIVNNNYSNSIPWDLRFAYSLGYTNTNRNGQISNNSLMFSGNVELSPRWKVGVSSGYDFKEMGFTNTNLRFERDLESWRLNFQWSPFRTGGTWYFFIGINSSLLSDLKWEKRRVPDRNIN